MAAKINLLPQELTANKDVASLARVLNVVAVAFGFMFLILGAVGIVTFVLLSRNLTELKDQQALAKAQVRELEDAENTLVLIKDRVEKISVILSDRLAEETFRKQKLIANSLPENVVFDSSEIQGEKSVLGLLAASSLGMSQLFSDITQSTDFISLVLENISRDPFEGYQIDLGVF